MMEQILTVNENAYILHKAPDGTIGTKVKMTQSRQKHF